jgi:hypothetical protein
LQRYRAAEGRYPPDLDALVPSYLAVVPRAGWRYVYGYHRCGAGDRYVLAFREAGVPDGSYAYSSASGEWRCSGDLPPGRRESCNW